MTTTPRCWNCQYELTGLQVDDHCPECGTPVWSQRPPTIAAEAAHHAFVWGLLSLVLFFVCLGPFAALLAIPALRYAKKTDQELVSGLLTPEQVRRVRAGRIMAWISVSLALGLLALYGVMFLLPWF